MSKVISLQQAVGLVKDGETIAFGGNVLHRSPNEIARQLALAGKRHLHLVKTAVAYEIDLLSAAGCLDKASIGFVGYESQFGLCRFFRKKVENGDLQVFENACYTIITALRAASQGVPFLPVRGLLGSDLIKTMDWRMVRDPYSGEELVAIPAIRPDVAFIHVQEADVLGNGRIIGPKYEDSIIARAAKKVVLTCEKIVDSAVFEKTPEYADISGVLVSHVVELPGGAKPGSCHGHYDINTEELTEFLAVEEKDMLGYLTRRGSKGGRA